MFVFYDTETTGLDKDFIQILQIGMLFTDDDMNILATKKIDCRNSSWDIPSPAAMLTTGFTPDNLKKSKNSNYEMMQQTNDWLRGQHWPITFIGYNSIDYDEPVLAQNFYQNLLPANLTSSSNPINGEKNGRADVMHMVETLAVYMPGALKLEIQNNNGSPSLTLKNVARQNGVLLSDDDAHDALNDIKATVGVAKVVKKVAPQIWEQSLKLSTVEGVEKFLNDHEIFTYTDFMFGRKSVSSVMTSLTPREGSTAEHALFDLRNDPTPYLGMTAEQLKDVFLSKGNPFELVRKDSQPTLMPMELSDAILTEKDDVALFEKRAKLIKADKNFLANVAKAALLAKKQKWAAKPSPSQKMPETMINYRLSGPVQAKLDAWAKQYHDAENWHERAVLTAGFREHFKDELAADPSFERFEKLAARLVYEHAPQELAESRQTAMKKFIAYRVLDPDPEAKYMTIPRARTELAKIEKMRADPKSEKWKEITDSDIRKLKLFYTAIEKEYAPYVSQPVVKPLAPTPVAPKPDFRKVANDDAPASPEVIKPAANSGPKV